MKTEEAKNHQKKPADAEDEEGNNQDDRDDMDKDAAGEGRYYCSWLLLLSSQEE